MCVIAGGRERRVVLIRSFVRGAVRSVGSGEIYVSVQRFFPLFVFYPENERGSGTTRRERFFGRRHALRQRRHMAAPNVVAITSDAGRVFGSLCAGTDRPQRASGDRERGDGFCTPCRLNPAAGNDVRLKNPNRANAFNVIRLRRDYNINASAAIRRVLRDTFRYIRKFFVNASGYARLGTLMSQKLQLMLILTINVNSDIFYVTLFLN